ncbi:hypothetical protein V2J52_03195 [Georgenia sp. MJ173]|uniref:hypothetical protein n=1 Tax=Georgenia sunbinii TaxID=3117728 RepID=UPI002F26948A
MPADSDALILESAKVHRQRLRGAFLHGELVDRRPTKDNVRRFIGSVVFAALACAGCAGWSFVQANTGDQAATAHQTETDAR